MNIKKLLAGSLFMAGALLFAVSTCAWGQTNLTGYWKFSVPNRGVAFLELKQTGDEIYVAGRGGMPEKPNGTLQGGKLHVEISSPFGPPNPKRVTVYDAVVAGEQVFRHQKGTGWGSCLRHSGKSDKGRSIPGSSSPA